jgi:hypothetical protein
LLVQEETAPEGRIPMYFLAEKSNIRNTPQSARAAAIDSEWFEANAHRSYLIRPALKREVRAKPPAGTRMYCVVRQIMRGARVRLFVAYDKPIPDGDSEQRACELWHAAARKLLDPAFLAHCDEGERQGRAVQ